MNMNTIKNMQIQELWNLKIKLKDTNSRMKVKKNY